MQKKQEEEDEGPILQSTVLVLVGVGEDKADARKKGGVGKSPREGVKSSTWKGVFGRIISWIDALSHCPNSEAPLFTNEDGASFLWVHTTQLFFFFLFSAQ